MHFGVSGPLLASFLAATEAVAITLTPEQAAQLPPAAQHTINFTSEIKPIFEASCIKCHGRGRQNGGFRLDNRETVLKGGDSGVAIVPGKSAESLLISLVQGFDPDSVMPKKGTRLKRDQIGLLRAWIDQGAPWDSQVSFGRLEPVNLKPRMPQIPPGKEDMNPVDRFLAVYYKEHGLKTPGLVTDQVFARRAYLDIVGLLPSPTALENFVTDRKSGKRERLIQTLLEDNRGYAENWLSFWNDMLRNDYKGTGYIDGGRKQITRWLYSSLSTNMPYNQFVAQLVDPVPESEGFTKGIVWRGVVNASQTPEMQAAQSISQVFMGVNLKCASCHDSFINDLTLADSYGLAGIYADGPLEMVRCDKPLGKTATPKFLYPELGILDGTVDKKARLRRLAEIITQPNDGRLTRTLVNRLWQKFFGRGLIEPADEMDKPAWNQDLLDWLAEDFVAHGYDVKFLITRLLTSKAYQSRSVPAAEQNVDTYVFQGPSVRRMTAEQFRDALGQVTGVGYSSAAADVPLSEPEQKRFAPVARANWIWNDPQAAEKAKPGHVYFRKSVQLPSVPQDAMALLVCDNSFTLYANGKLVGTGNDFKALSVFDLKSFLRPGENLIAIDAVNHDSDNKAPGNGPVNPGSENPAGLLFYARLRTTENGISRTNDFASDVSWLCSEQAPDNWREPTANVSNWRKADKLGDMGLAPWRVSREQFTAKFAAAYPGQVRASLVAADTLLLALGRPNREQIVTCRASAATTLQAVELTNGETLSEVLKRGAKHVCESSTSSEALVNALFENALGRKPTKGELKTAADAVGRPVDPSAVEDVLWTLAMLPEFQLIY